MSFIARKTLGFFSCLLAAALLATAPAIAQEDNIPEYIPLQGQLTNQNVSGGAGNEVAEDGVYTLTVRIYEAPTGSSILWEDTFQNLPVVNGVFNVILGSQRSLNDIASPVGDEDLLDRLAQRGVLYVGLTISERDGLELVGPVEMLPRLTLLPVALSMKSKKAINSDLLDNRHWDYYFTGDKAKDANKLDGYDWNDLLTGPGAVGDGSVKVKGAFLPEDKITPTGATVQPGTMLEQMGGLIDYVIDPRSLDSNNDGTPDLALGAATTLAGSAVTTTYTTWMVCAQNSQGTLKFPDPATPGLAPAVAASYEVIDVSLRGLTIPAKQLTTGQIANPTYDWRELTPAPGQTAIPVGQSAIPQGSNKAQGMAYDPALDSYWLMIDNFTAVYIIWRDDQDDSRYKFRQVDFPPGTDSITTEGDGLEVVIDPITSDRLLLVGSGVSGDNFHLPFTTEIVGTTPETATLINWYQGIVGGASSANRYAYGAIYDHKRHRFHQWGGRKSQDGAIQGTYLRYDLANNLLTFGENISSSTSSVAEAYTAFDPVNDIGYIVGGEVGVSVELRTFDPVTELFTSLGRNDMEGDSTGIGFIHPFTRKFMGWGGRTDNNLGNNSLWLFDPDEPNWDITYLQTNAPEARMSHVGCMDTKRQRLIMFGGTDIGTGNNILADLWELDFGGKVATQGTIIKVGP
ncbi:MAG: kelch repeat-containing protein [Sumerlaeia bacterium]